MNSHRFIAIGLLLAIGTTIVNSRVLKRRESSREMICNDNNGRNITVISEDNVDYYKAENLEYRIDLVDEIQKMNPDLTPQAANYDHSPNPVQYTPKENVNITCHDQDTGVEAIVLKLGEEKTVGTTTYSRTDPRPVAAQQTEVQTE